MMLATLKGESMFASGTFYYHDEEVYLSATAEKVTEVDYVQRIKLHLDCLATRKVWAIKWEKGTEILWTPSLECEDNGCDKPCQYRDRDGNDWCAEALEAVFGPEPTGINVLSVEEFIAECS